MSIRAHMCLAHSSAFMAFYLACLAGSPARPARLLACVVRAGAAEASG